VRTRTTRWLTRARRRHACCAQEVGLPSYTARFEELPPSSSGGSSGARTRSAPAPAPPPEQRRGGGFWWRAAAPAGAPAARARSALTAPESGVVRLSVGGAHVCTLALPPASASETAPGFFRVPHTTLSLPSFSGGTPAQPGLLRYALRLRARVRPCGGAAASTPLAGSAAHAAAHPLAAVLGGRPLLTLAFDDMVMDVGQPQPVPLLAPAPVAQAAVVQRQRAAAAK
jgi:hypothetical protein